MINSENAKTQYVTAGVNGFAIGFEYGLDDLGNPEIAVTLNGIPLQFGTGYTLSLDKKSIFLVDGAGRGNILIIERDIDFVQDSDYQLGRIDPEQIEDDFDLSVMRDQQIRQELVDYKNVTDSALEDISEQLVEHQDSIDTLTQNVSDLETNKADKSSVYTKGETDDKLALKADKADTYTKSDVDTKLSAKADKETVYTKTETDSKVNGKQDALSTDQMAAVNSGITAAKVASYDAYAGEISAAKTTADKADNAAEVAQQTANLAGQEAAQALSSLAGKVNIAQGAENAGKVMTVGEDGNLAPADAPGTSLPDQSGNAGKFLTTDGTNARWGEVQAAAITTDATLTGAGTTDSPLGIAQSVKDSIDGKVSKSGDTMTGTLNLAADVDIDAFTIDSYRMGLNGAQLDLYYKTTPVFSYNPASGLQVGSLQKYFGTGSGVLGSNEYPWVNVYTEKLNNGADIAIPTTGGTMALLSDIPDISNLATKAEVQQEIQDAIGTIETALAEV